MESGRRKTPGHSGVGRSKAESSGESGNLQEVQGKFRGGRARSQQSGEPASSRLDRSLVDRCVNEDKETGSSRRKARSTLSYSNQEASADTFY